MLTHLVLDKKYRLEVWGWETAILPIYTELQMRAGTDHVSHADGCAVALSPHLRAINQVRVRFLDGYCNWLTFTGGKDDRAPTTGAPEGGGRAPPAPEAPSTSGESNLVQAVQVPPQQQLHEAPLLVGKDVDSADPFNGAGGVSDDNEDDYEDTSTDEGDPDDFQEGEPDDSGGGLLQEDIPEPFCDPLTFECMEDPVVTPQGISYERAVIMDEIRLRGRDPFTQEPLSEGDLRPNRALKDLIELYRSGKG
jgi:hypothetical protein